MRILYDGWPLLREPNSPAARHLLTIVARLPEGVQATFALPDEAPKWLAGAADFRLISAGNRQEGRARWEQRTLPKIAKEIDAAAIHSTSSAAPLVSETPVIISPAGFGAMNKEPSGFGERLRTALGQGGMARGARILWPSDLPVAIKSDRVITVPPITHPNYSPVPFGEQESPNIPGVELPETYSMYHGPGTEAALRDLLQAWTWAAGPIGEYYPLVLLGLNDRDNERAEQLAAEMKLADNIRILPPIDPQYLVGLYQNCSALYHPAGISPWGDPVRHGMACGIPVAAWEGAESNALAGPAAFLVERGDLRSFGAAMISVVVKDSLREQLSEKAVERSRVWREGQFASRLGEIYRDIGG